MVCVTHTDTSKLGGFSREELFEFARQIFKHSEEQGWNAYVCFTETREEPHVPGN